MRTLGVIAIGLCMAVLSPFIVQAASGHLSDVTWQAVEIGGEASQAGVRSTLEISSDGTASGLAGCNRYNGMALIDGRSLSFKPFAVTRMMCAEPEMKQEQRFLDALADTARWETDGASLVLYDEKGDARLRFTAQTTEISFRVKLAAGEGVDRQTIEYRCGDAALEVEYINAGTISLAVLRMEDQTVVASQVISGSGVRYAGGQYIWWAKGTSEATLQKVTDRDASPGVRCRGQ